jgi:hypothetical protein
VDPSPGDVSLSPLPTELARERGAVLHRALRTLPVALLEPLLRGLRRHADQLVPGHLATGNGGCAVGMMLHELALDPSWQEAGALPAPERRWRSMWRQASIYDSWPKLAASYPRLHHVEIVFDVTCKRLRAEGVMDHDDAPRAVGLWMAAETQSEINMRHLEAGAQGTDAPPLPPRSVPLDAELFEATVERLMQLRPGLSRAQATTAVESLIGARRLEPEPLFMPSAWENELELQRQRLAATSR